MNDKPVGQKSPPAVLAGRQGLLVPLGVGDLVVPFHQLSMALRCQLPALQRVELL